MNRTGRALALGCLLLLQPLLAHAQAGGNSLLIPAMGRCTLNTQSQDLSEALAVCQKAADEGDAQAQYELGEFYYEGTPRDLNQALSYFEKASLQGHAQAQFKLGTMFFRGEGVPANNIQAYIVLKMAAVNGAEEALDTADEVAEHMQRDELEVATQVLGQIFRKYLMELQSADGRSPFSPLP
ncbi:TPR repeat, SEL1 subfamily protein [Pseudomonas chlororaphis]|uniref:tetratricopeptide repeat protein n=1 Tax=Pseudomonas chlororaphis TaxID=587753 RepID=UPI000F56AB38|nr:tetratricopeptide repeat protein [Pseudomonas chlororaphis]AZD10730.1 TPR repeat, SEL1 subfamily protein [Pseudomonas chlororaphis]